MKLRSNPVFIRLCTEHISSMCERNNEWPTSEGKSHHINLDILLKHPFKASYFSPLSFLLFPFSPRCLSLRPSFLLFSPSLCPISPFLPALQKAGAWALALNFDLACNQSYPWALPSSQTRDSSLPPTPLPSSISCSLFVPIFFSLSFLRSLWILNGHAGF